MKKLFLLFILFCMSLSVYAYDFDAYWGDVDNEKSIDLSLLKTVTEGKSVDGYSIKLLKDDKTYYIQLISNETTETFVWFTYEFLYAIEHYKWLQTTKFDKSKLINWRQMAMNAEFDKNNYIKYYILLIHDQEMSNAKLIRR